MIKRFDASIILKKRGRATKTNILFGPFCLNVFCKTGAYLLVAVRDFESEAKTRCNFQFR